MNTKILLGLQIIGYLRPCGTVNRDAAEREEMSLNAQPVHEVVLKLQAGEIAAAVNEIIAYEASQARPRGLGVDWTDAAVGRELNKTLAAIFSAKPAILDGVPEPEMVGVRVRAALLELLGFSVVPKWVGLPEIGHRQMGADATARMLIFYVQSEAERTQWIAAGIGIKRCEIDTAQDACPACAEHAGKVFDLDNRPELPHQDCAHPMGCRCMFSAILDD